MSSLDDYRDERSFTRAAREARERGDYVTAARIVREREEFIANRTKARSDAAEVKELRARLARVTRERDEALADADKAARFSDALTRHASEVEGLLAKVLT